eukprot:6190933-Pleurochrysis_carterae.AAC.1
MGARDTAAAALSPAAVAATCAVCASVVALSEHAATLLCVFAALVSAASARRSIGFNKRHCSVCANASSALLRQVPCCRLKQLHNAASCASPAGISS